MDKYEVCFTLGLECLCHIYSTAIRTALKVAGESGVQKISFTLFCREKKFVPNLRTLLVYFLQT